MDSSESRRRRLDELFADEPHLSTTMKARRLSEKLREAENAFPPGCVVTRQLGSPVTTMREALTLAEAADLLRGAVDAPGVDPGLAARLGTFRAVTLHKWLQGLPQEFRR